MTASAGAVRTAAVLCDAEDRPGGRRAVHEAGMVAAGPGDEAGRVAGPLGGDRTGEPAQDRDEVPGAPGDAGCEDDGVRAASPMNRG